MRVTVVLTSLLGLVFQNAFGFVARQALFRSVSPACGRANAVSALNMKAWSDPRVSGVNVHPWTGMPYPGAKALGMSCGRSPLDFEFGL